MKLNKYLLGLVVLLAPVSAFAQQGWLDLNGTPTLMSKTGSHLTIGTQSASQEVKFQIGGTEVAAVTSTGFDVSSTLFSLRVPEYVATPATNLTPAAGTNDFRVNTSIAAAGPTNMAIALPASPTDGEVRWGFNGSANPVVVAALGTPVMNGGAGRRTVWPTLTVMRCRYSAALASWQCYPSAAVPTPIA